MYRCPICDQSWPETFATLEDLDTHVDRVHLSRDRQEPTSTTFVISLASCSLFTGSTRVE